ncbi:MAG TPA: hypothetical protein VGK93_07700 [Candidatus Eisenbacteria bacterium]|jgi:hypothetical protein
MTALVPTIIHDTLTVVVRDTIMVPYPDTVWAEVHVLMPPKAIQLPPTPFLESQLAGVLAGALLTAMLSLIGWSWTSRRQKQQARARLMGHLAEQIRNCSAAAVILREVERVTRILMAPFEPRIPAPLSDDLASLSDQAVAGRVRKWYMYLAIAVQSAVVVDDGISRLADRGVSIPESMTMGLASVADQFQRLERSGERIHALLWVANRWWNRPWLRRLRRRVRRRRW